MPSVSDGSVKVVALTNDGTVYSTSTSTGTSQGGSCCPSVKDGQIVLQGSNGSCFGFVGAIGNGPGLTIRETIASLEVDALPDFCSGCEPNVVPFWGVVDWTLHPG